MTHAFKVSVFFVMISGFFATACADGEPCDPDQELDRNFCVAKSAPEGGGGEASGPPEPAQPSDVFGAVCADDSECGDDAPTCAKAPCDDEGICSVLGCDSEPDAVVCPTAWECFALGDVCLEE